ncbi:seipin-like, partial [Uloborus diversus]|uniref:seipin-like n=1 Tax=Uloborus diversus TaxID=327109 RepID=UPI002409643C
ALLHYKTPLFKIIYTLFFAPGLLVGSVEEKQTLVISLFENFVEDGHKPAHFAYIEIQGKTTEIYSASLRIHARFTGLRYLMYYWPVLSALVGIGTNFFLLVLVIALIWARQIANGNSIRHSNVDPREQQKFTEEIRRAMQRKYSQKHTEKLRTSISEEEFEDAVLVPDDGEGELSRSLRRKTEEIFGESPPIGQRIVELEEGDTSPLLRRRKTLEQCETEL